MKSCVLCENGTYLADRAVPVSHRMSAGMGAGVIVLLGVVLGLAVGPAQAGLISSTWTGSGDGTNWGNASNWNPAQVPNNGADTFEVSTGLATVTVNGAFTIDRLMADGVINIGSNTSQSLGLSAGTSTINGQVRLVDWASYGGSAVLNIAGPVTLAGTGSIDFASNGANVVSGSGTATIGAGFTLQSLGGSSGSVSAPLVVNGVVRANGGTLTITNGITNNGLVQSSSGTLTLSGMSVANSSGQLSVQSAANFIINNSSVVGGTLTGGGTFDINGSCTFDGTGGLTLDAGTTVQFGASGPETLTVVSGLTNNHEIQLADWVNYGGAADLAMRGTEADNNVYFTGTGKIIFASNGSNEIVASGADPDAQLNLGAGQTLTTAAGGTGSVRVPVVNAGVIEARAGTVTLHENVTNNNLIQTAEGGSMTLNTLRVNNGSGTITVAGGTTVHLIDSTIAGGLINGSGSIDTAGTASVLDGSAGLTLDNATVLVGGSSPEALTVSGHVANSGTIRLEDWASYGGDAQLRIDGNVRVDGAGQLRFASNGTNQIVPVHAGDTLTIGPEQTLLVGQGCNGRITAGLDNLGTIAGAGTIDVSGAAFVNNGTVAPGLSAGLLTMTGTYNQSATGILDIEIGGYTAGSQYDRLVINGAAYLDGFVDVSLISGFLAQPGDKFDILIASSIATYGLRVLPEDAQAWMLYKVGTTTVRLEYIPEPSSLGLLLFGVLCVLRRKR